MYRCLLGVSVAISPHLPPFIDSGSYPQETLLSMIRFCWSCTVIICLAQILLDYDSSAASKSLFPLRDFIELKKTLINFFLSTSQQAGQVFDFIGLTKWFAF